MCAFDARFGVARKGRIRQRHARTYKEYLLEAVGRGALPEYYLVPQKEEELESYQQGMLTSEP